MSGARGFYLLTETIKTNLLADENVNIDFDVPTDIELTQLGVRHSEEFEDDLEDDEDNEDFLTA